MMSHVLALEKEQFMVLICRSFFTFHAQPPSGTADSSVMSERIHQRHHMKDLLNLYLHTQCTQSILLRPALLARQAPYANMPILAMSTGPVPVAFTFRMVEG